MGYKFRLGVDTGGTFTDLCLIDEETGKVSITKISSTPANPALAVVEGIKKIMRIEGTTSNTVNFLIHGTTVATNALLEHKGAKAALITTKGFEDVLHIGRQNRPKLYDFWARRPDPIIPRHLRYGVPERILYTGEILKDLDEKYVRDIVKEMKKRRVESVAVSLLHSYVNPIHEKKIKEIISRDYPTAYVTLSSEVLPEFREYERTSTVTVNAFVMPKVNAYIADIVTKLQDLGINSGLYIMQSNGGVITAEMAREMSARTVLSGPAGGVIAGAFISKVTNRKNVITIDMGGTSSDICLIDKGKPKFTTESEIGGYPIKLPMIDINTIGAGGGSIAWIDAGGALRVGPQSAGADPGPVCYEKGGKEPTVTDANVVLRRINPKYLLDGEMKINFEAARLSIIERIAKSLNITLEEAAQGIITVVNANMVRGIRRVSVERGYDPREFSLVCFGGAGPVHGVEMARSLDISEVIIPKNPGIASAFGMLSADVRHDYVQTYIIHTKKAQVKDLISIYRDLENKGIEQLTEEGFSKRSMVLIGSADMRYVGQAYELSVPVKNGELTQEDIIEVTKLFHNLHYKAYGYSREKEEVEFVNLRVVALGKLPRLRLPKERVITKGSPEVKGYRDVFFESRYIKTPIYERDEMLAGHKIQGPTIIEQLDSTTVIFPNQTATIDEYGNILIKIGGN